MIEQMRYIQVGALSDPLPFTVAPSGQSESKITYTFTGSKPEGVRGIAMSMLGVPWCVSGGFIMFSIPLGWPNAGVKLTLGGFSLFVAGCVLIYFGVRLIKHSRTKGELCIDTLTSKAQFRSSKINAIDSPKVSDASLFVCGVYDEKTKCIEYWCVSVETESCWVVLGVLRSLDLARDYAQVVSLETGLTIEDLAESMAITTIYHKRLFSWDKRALKKPISTKPIKLTI